MSLTLLFSLKYPTDFAALIIEFIIKVASFCLALFCEELNIGTIMDPVIPRRVITNMNSMNENPLIFDFLFNKYLLGLLILFKVKLLYSCK